MQLNILVISSLAVVTFSGSGKTAAFLIPILSRIFEEGPPPLPDVSIIFCQTCNLYMFLLEAITGNLFSLL